MAQRITIELPDAVVREIARIAEATQQSIEAIVARSVTSHLPPSVEGMPPDMAADLLAMQGFSIEELLAIARSQFPLERQERYELLQARSETEVFDDRAEFQSLRREREELTVRKAYARAVLRWQGYRIPERTEDTRTVVFDSGKAIGLDLLLRDRIGRVCFEARSRSPEEKVEETTQSVQHGVFGGLGERFRAGAPGVFCR